MKAIDDLVSELGGEAVGCAVLAVETVVTAGKTSGAAALSPIELRANELIKKYGWKEAVPPPVPTQSTGSRSHASIQLDNLAHPHLVQVVDSEPEAFIEIGESPYWIIVPEQL